MITILQTMISFLICFTKCRRIPQDSLIGCGIHLTNDSKKYQVPYTCFFRAVIGILFSLCRSVDVVKRYCMEVQKHIIVKFTFVNAFTLYYFQFFVRLDHIRKCFTQKDGIFVLEEFSEQSSMANVENISKIYMMFYALFFRS